LISDVRVLSTPPREAWKLPFHLSLNTNIFLSFPSENSNKKEAEEEETNENKKKRRRKKKKRKKRAYLRYRELRHFWGVLKSLSSDFRIHQLA